MKIRSPREKQAGFTLMELLTVIAVIGILTAFTIPGLRGVQRSAKISRVKAELQQVETALENYKSRYGFYPPSNSSGSAAALFNPLYYELSGVTNVMVDSKPCYQTFSAESTVGTEFYTHLFNLGGVVNCSKAGGGEDAAPAKNFLPALKPNQVGALPITNSYGGFTVNFLSTSVGGPDTAYQPMGIPGLNPFRY